MRIVRLALAAALVSFVGCVDTTEDDTDADSTSEVAPVSVRPADGGGGGGGGGALSPKPGPTVPPRASASPKPGPTVPPRPPLAADETAATSLDKPGPTGGFHVWLRYEVQGEP